MKHSSNFFENKDCKYYPCHDGLDELNCLFCYCPLYPLKNCPGNFITLEVEDEKIKDCSGCTFPHRVENYEVIMKTLSKSI